MVDATGAAEALEAAHAVHCVGVAGSGMSSMALLLRALGKTVSGSDLGDGPTSQGLRQAGVEVFHGHSAAHLDAAELVIRSAAVSLENPEVAEASRRGLPVITHAQALGALMERSYGLAVAGTHGKTTTTALLAWILFQAGLDPTLALGGESVDFGASARLGSGPFLVAEADEFDRRFLALQPRVAIVTNVEADHLDYFHDLAEIEEAFRQFVSRLPTDGLVVTCADAAGLERLEFDRPRLRYGFASHADWLLSEYQPRAGGGGTFTLRAPGGWTRRFDLALSGRHNALNAAAAAAVASHVGVEPTPIARALATFRGARRRFETRGVVAGVTVMDDYAHHPTELRATLAAARGIHAGRVFAVFQPHTSHRTLALLDDFAAAFGDADRVVLLPIYHPAGREPEALPIRSEDLAALIPGGKAETAGSLEEAADRLAGSVRAGDLVIALGAGDVNQIADDLLKRLEARGE